MDKAVILQNVGILLGVTDDALFNLLINKAEKDIKVFCNDEFKDEDGTDAFPENLESALEDLVVYRYNRRSTEGMKSENQGDRSASFTDDIPVDIKNRLYRYRKLRVF